MCHGKISYKSDVHLVSRASLLSRVIEHLDLTIEEKVNSAHRDVNLAEFHAPLAGWLCMHLGRGVVIVHHVTDSIGELEGVGLQALSRPIRYM